MDENDCIVSYCTYHVRFPLFVSCFIAEGEKFGPVGLSSLRKNPLAQSTGGAPLHVKKFIRTQILVDTNFCESAFVRKNKKIVSHKNFLAIQ